MFHRTRYKKSEDSRRQVIEAAVRALADHGLGGASVGDIARAAGMSKGVVHYHFESKRDLVAQVLGRCAEALAARVRGAWNEQGTPAERVRRVLRELWATRSDGSPEMRVLADLMAHAVHDAELREAVTAILRASREELVGEFVQSFQSLGLRPKLPAPVVLRLVMATLDGLGLHALFDPPTAQEQAEILRALEVVAFSMFEV